MKLTIVYDNEVYLQKTGLTSGWGFSCLVETQHQKILFDTGANGKKLLGNMKTLGIKPEEIDKIVISHEHWDHNGGLKALASTVKKTELFRLIEKKPSENMVLNQVSGFKKIAEKVFTTGRLQNRVDEQSLILKGREGGYVLVGCSHPGVEKILETAGKQVDVIGLIGGLHDFHDFPVIKNLGLICPCHCTKHKETIKKLYPEKYVAGGVGRILEV